MLQYNELTTNDTIVALSTAPGIGAIAVIRLSGQDAIRIIDSVFHGKNLEEQATHTLHFGTIRKGDVIVDEVVVSLFKEPNSYTKENVVEISCHGSPYIQQQIIDLLMLQGARLAQPGEFTLRAFLHGRMDLSQAEAVADLIASGSEASHKVAMQQLRGGFSHQVQDLRTKLVHFASMIELELDFGEEDVQFADRNDLKKLILELKVIIDKLMHSFKLGNVIKNGVNTVIAGRPNAGKSTLLNRLLNEERAIVSDIPGTTRDTIEEVINIDGILFRLIDTAGIREATDAIERIGVQRTMEKISQSALVIYLFDVTELSKEELEKDIAQLHKEVPVLVVGNKTDLATGIDLKTKFNIDQEILFISSKDETVIEKINQALVAQVMGQNINLNDTIVANARHYEALKMASDALDDTLTGLGRNITGDMLALDIRQALHALGLITGEITTDDLLANIFSKFCIGK